MAHFGQFARGLMKQNSQKWPIFWSTHKRQEMLVIQVNHGCICVRQLSECLRLKKEVA